MHVVRFFRDIISGISVYQFFSVGGLCMAERVFSFISPIELFLVPASAPRLV